MTNSELSNEFDILYNNITSNQAPGLNEYEKSVFLTKAQSQLVNEYFNNRTDGFGGGFDGTQKRQYDFSSIIKVVELTELIKQEATSGGVVPLDSRSKLFAFPLDYYLAINEIIEDKEGTSIVRQYSVIPINHSDYQRLMLKPYNLPVKKAVWRLLSGKILDAIINPPVTPIDDTEVTTNNDDSTKYHIVAEIIGSFRSNTNLSYKLRYVKSLSPIILENLSNYGEDISISGKDTISECELPEETHQEILERAVTLAKIAWQGATVTQAARQQDNE